MQTPTQSRPGSPAGAEMLRGRRAAGKGRTGCTWRPAVWAGRPPLCPLSHPAGKPTCWDQGGGAGAWIPGSRWAWGSWFSSKRDSSQTPGRTSWAGKGGGGETPLSIPPGAGVGCKAPHFGEKWLNLYVPSGNGGGGWAEPRSRPGREATAHCSGTLTHSAPGSWEAENFGNGERESEGWLGAGLP